MSDPETKEDYAKLESIDAFYAEFNSPGEGGYVVHAEDMFDSQQEITNLKARLEEAEEVAKERFDRIRKYEKDMVDLIHAKNRYQKALEFYANRKNYHHVAGSKIIEHRRYILDDDGVLAREALNPEGVGGDPTIQGAGW